MKKAIYPGSFDPVTHGHIDIIKRISRLYAECTVLVSQSPNKKYLFTAQERAELIKACLGDCANINVEIFNGLTVEYARSVGAQVMVRGLRALSDFEYETAMANVNRKLAPEIETVLVFASEQYTFVSSRMVKEVAIHHGALENLVPLPVADALKGKLL